MNLTRTFDAESEALSLTDVKDHLRITGTDDDDALRLFIAGIRRKTEKYLCRTLVTATWELKLDCFKSVVNLPMYPIQSITSVAYVDTDGDSQTLDSSLYQFDKGGRLMPAYGQSWPSTRSQLDAVTITYVAGETHAGNVYPDIKLAMLLWIGSCDLNREDVVIGTIISDIPDGARSLLEQHRLFKL